MSPHKAWVCLKMAIIDMPVINRVKEDHELEKKQLQGETKPAALAIYKEMWKLSSEWEYPGRLRQRTQLLLSIGNSPSSYSPGCIS